VTKKKIPICAYCGEQPGKTKDHVIPRCLFPGPLPIDGNAVKVPACEGCNQAKARNDDYLRDYLVTDWCSGSSPAVLNLLGGSAGRSFESNRSEFMRGAKASVKIIPKHTPGGVYIGHVPASTLEVDRINTIFTTIARGIYYKIRGEMLPDRYVYEVRRIDPFQVQSVVDEFQAAKANGPYIMDPEVFSCLFIYAEEDRFLTRWLFWFYNSVFVSVWSDPPVDERGDWYAPLASN